MNHSSLVIDFQNNVDFVQMAHLDVPWSCFCCSLSDMAALKVLPIIHTTIVIVISYSFSSASIMMLRFDDSLVPSFPSSCCSPFFPPHFPLQLFYSHQHHHHDGIIAIITMILPTQFSGSSLCGRRKLGQRRRWL